MMTLPTTLQEARYLWELCFPSDDATFLDFYFSRVAKVEDTYIDYDAEGNPIGHIGILRYTTQIDNQSLHLAYISGACTHPKARRMGVMERLMQRVEKEERAKGTDALILIPASEELRRYYAKHFHFTDTAPRYSLTIEQFIELKHLDIPRGYNSPEALLASCPPSLCHIAYSESQAQAIIDEYKLYPSGIVELWQSGGDYVGLLLARNQDEAIYVDYCMTTDHSVRVSLLRRLQERHPDKPIVFPYIFREDAISTDAELKVIPWGMSLKLIELGGSTMLSKLGISLVHN